MSENEQVIVHENRGVDQALTAAEIRAQVNRIQEVMQAVMKDGIHYGRIPGCGDKPTLLKPGAEKILSTFQIAIEPIVTDMSGPDECRFRVEARATSALSGRYLGSGVGEASSSEEKYHWRKSVCEGEFAATPEDRRRDKWYKDGSTSHQVRVTPADIANTVLKMAKKRSQIDVCLTVTAASDCFTQDIEDMPREVAEGLKDEQRPPIKRPESKSSTTDSAPADGTKISEKQYKRLYAIAHKAGVTMESLKNYLLKVHGIEHGPDIPKDKYDSIVIWAENGGQESVTE